MMKHENMMKHFDYDFSLTSIPMNRAQFVRPLTYDASYGYRAARSNMKVW